MILKIIVFIILTAFSALLYVLGSFLSFPTGFFSTPNGFFQRLVGYTIVFFAICITFGSFQLFRTKDQNSSRRWDRKNTLLVLIPALLIFSGYLYFSYGQYWLGKVNNRIEQQNSLKEMKFKIYYPSKLPGSYKEKDYKVVGVEDKYLYSEYRNSANELIIIMQFRKPSILLLTDSKCQISGGNFEIIYSSNSSSDVNTKCRKIQSKNSDIYVMKHSFVDEKNLAVTVINDTLVTIYGYNFSEEDLKELVDSMRVLRTD